jgi:hypothetical protein
MEGTAMSSKAVFYGRTKNPLTFSNVRALTIYIRGCIANLVEGSKEYREGMNAPTRERALPVTKVSSIFMISVEFRLNGEERSLTILPHDDYTISISIGASGCAPEVMQAIRPVLLSVSVGIDWLALSYRADDAGDAFEMVVGSINDLGDGDDE